nr:MGMT family protein [Candidatus Sigynarchaeota archaeon]
MHEPFTRRVVAIIKQIPPGKVLTYGLIAKLAGNPRGARQISRILHSLSEKERLPWHRVVNATGNIVLASELEKDEQASLLAAEGIVVDDDLHVDLKRYLWQDIDLKI